MICDHCERGVQITKKRLESGVPGFVFEGMNSKWGLYEKLTDEDLTCFSLGNFGQFMAYDVWFAEQISGDEEVAEVLKNMQWGHPMVMLVTWLHLMGEFGDDVNRLLKAGEKQVLLYLKSAMEGYGGYIGV